MLGFDSQNKVMITMDINQRLQEFIESEGKSCSFVPELITSLAVHG